MTDVLKQAKALIRQHNESGFIHRDATMLLPELVAECERLQENQCTPEKCYGEIARLQEELKITADRAAHNTEQDAAREQILREELDRWQKIAAKAAATANKAIETTDVDWHKMVSEEDIQQAARELGIATSDHIVEANQFILTKEQRAALDNAISALELVERYSEIKLADERKVLRSMLDQSRPAWEITEDRKIALHQVEMLLTGNQPKDLHWDIRAIVIIRAMITEASQ